MVGIMGNNGTTIGVVVFDTMEVIMNMLEDERLVCHATIADGYNIWTGKATESDCFEEFHTGDLWEPTREEYIGEDDSKFPVPLVGFYDKTHTDEKGVL